MSLWQTIKESSPLGALLKPAPEKVAARELYERIVGQSRQPVFYLDGGVADNVDGRFDLIALHVFLVLHRFKEEDAGSSPIAQALFDVFFQNMDESLREMGVGDLSIGKKIQKMAQAFYGRVAAYEDGLKSNEPEPLNDALCRNLYRTSDVSPDIVDLMARYVRRQVAHLAGQDLDGLASGRVTFERLRG